MIINQLDLGGSHPYATPIVGQTIGTVLVEGSETIVWARGSIERKQTVSFWVQAWQAIGGQTANSGAALKYLLKQVEELASNRDLQPVYIQWTATAQLGAALNASEMHDGWYAIDDFEPNYSKFIVAGLVQCRMTVTQVAPAAPRRVALGYSGGALSSNYSGAARLLIAYPVAATVIDFGTYGPTLAAAEGTVSTQTPKASPSPFVLSTTLSNGIWKGGVHVYDTINTGTNPVPTSGGTFVNANWVEVFYTDHDFVGDCVVTNGLLLLLFQATVQQICKVYVWQTALAVANWQLIGTPDLSDSSNNGLICEAYSLACVGPEEVAVTCLQGGGNGEVMLGKVRLQRGRYEGRLDVTPLSTANNSGQGVYFSSSNANLKATYNSTHINDVPLAEAAPVPATDYGYGAALGLSGASFPYLYGLLYQNQPGTSQPGSYSATGTILSADSSLAQNATRSYGFFAIPYGVSGSYSTASLQAEAEGGTLQSGWTSQANAAASAGNEAKCASGTVINHSDIFGAIFSPATGVYDCWFRIKVTSAAGNVAEMLCGLHDATSGDNSQSTTLKANQVTTSYAWYRVATNVTMPLAHASQFIANTQATLGTDWFIDEAVLVPKTLNGTGGPQDIWQDWMYDRGVRLVRQ